MYCMGICLFQKKFNKMRIWSKGNQLAIPMLHRLTKWLWLKTEQHMISELVLLSSNQSVNYKNQLRWLIRRTWSQQRFHQYQLIYASVTGTRPQSLPSCRGMSRPSCRSKSRKKTCFRRNSVFRRSTFMQTYPVPYVYTIMTSQCPIDCTHNRVRNDSCQSYIGTVISPGVRKCEIQQQLHACPLYSDWT